MALDPADMAALTSAIQAGISNGFRTYFGPTPPTPPGGGAPPSPSPSPSPSVPPPPPGGGAPVPVTLNASGVTARVSDSFISEAERIGKGILNANATFFDQQAIMQNEKMVTVFRNLAESYGSGIQDITVEQLSEGNFDTITNRFARNQMEIFAGLRKEYTDSGGELQAILEGDFEELALLFGEFSEKLGNNNINAMNQVSSDTLRETVKFSKATGIEMSDVADLINVQFAQTGEASEKILIDIMNFSKQIGDAVGMVPKDLASDVMQVTLNTQTFTNIGVPAATRLAASLRQVGVSTQSFANLADQMMDFEGAASKAADFSAIFGVQMDAVELMVAASESPEALLEVMRKEITSQIGSFEDMSNAQQRAMGRLLGGFSIQETQSFLRGSTEMLNTMEKNAASAAARGMTADDTAKAMAESTLTFAKSAEQTLQLALDERFLSMAPNINRNSKAIAGYTQQLTSFVSANSDLGKLLDAKAVLDLETYQQGAVTTLEAEAVAAKVMVRETEELIRGTAGAINEATPVVTKAGEGVREAVNEIFGPKSMPKVFEPFEEGTEYLLNYLKTEYPKISSVYSESLKNIDGLTAETASSIPAQLSSAQQSALESMSGINQEFLTLAQDISATPDNAMGFNINEIKAAIAEAESTGAELSSILGSQTDEVQNLAAQAPAMQTINQENAGQAISPEMMESLTTAIVQAIQQGQQDLSQNINVTLEMDKRKMAEVLMSARTADGRQLVTFSA